MNKLLRSLLVFTISWSLLNFQLGVVMSVAHADSITIDDGEIRQDSSGHASRQAKIEDKDAEVNMSGTGGLTMITMIVIGLLTGKLIELCYENPTSDIWFAAGAGVLFILGEATAILGYTDDRKKSLNIHIGNEQNQDQQLDALIKQRETYKEMKSTAQTKRTLQRAAAVAFTAAAAIAGYDWFELDAAFKSCRTPITKLSTKAYALEKDLPPTGRMPSCKDASEIYENLLVEYENEGKKTASRTHFNNIWKQSNSLTQNINGCKIDISTTATNISTQLAASSSTAGTTTEALARKETKNNLLSQTQAEVTIKCNELKILLEDKTTFCVAESTEKNLPEAVNNSKPVTSEEAPSVKSAPVKAQPVKKTPTQASLNKAQKEFKKSIAPEGHSFGIIESPVDFIDDIIANAKSEIIKEKSNAYLDFNHPLLVLKKIIQKISDYLVPTAQAFNLGIMQGLGLGGGVIAGILSMQMDFFDWMNQLLATPGYRAVLWGGLTGMTGLAITETSSVIEKSEENIKILDKIIDRIQRLKTGVAYVNDGKRSVINSQVTAIDPRIQGARSRNRRAEILKGNINPCTSRLPNGQCASLKSQIENSGDFSRIPSQLQAVGSNLGGAVDAATGKRGLNTTTFNLASRVGDAKNAVDRIYKKSLGKINSRRAQDGKAPVDFKKQGLELLKSVKGVKESFTAGTINSSPNTTPSSASNISPSLTKDNSDNKLSKSKLLNYGGNIQKPRRRSRFRGVGISGAQKKHLAGERERLDALSQIQHNSDIVDNKDVLIFDVISSRYIKSGYPRLLDNEE